MSLVKRVLAIASALAALLPAGVAPMAAAAAGAQAVPVTSPIPLARAKPSPQDLLYACPTTLDRIGRIVAPVMVDGKGPFRFVVDTGANHSMISARLAQALGLTGRKDNLMSVMGVTGAEDLPWVPIARLEVGDLVMTNLKLPVSETPVMEGADGILGAASLSGDRIAVDFRHNEVWIGRSHGGGAWGFLGVPARRTLGGLLMVQALVGGVPVEAVIDTGSPRTLGNEALRKALVSATSKAPPPQASIYGVTNEVSSGDLAESPAISLGAVSIQDLAIVYTDAPIFTVWHLDSKPAVIVGMDVLGTVGDLVLDFAYPSIYVLPSETAGVQISHYDISDSPFQ